MRAIELLGSCVVAAGIAMALVQDAHALDEREAEIVGGASEAVTEPTKADTTFGPQSQPDASEPLSRGAAALPSRVKARHDLLAIGGLLYTRGTYSKTRDTAARLGSLATPTLFDLYADGRPSDRVRAFARGRLRYNYTVLGSVTTTTVAMPATQPTRVDVVLDQLWLKFDIGRTLFVTAGKQPLKWGTGRFWNPTDLLNPVLRDPLAAFDERLGVNLLKLHLPFEGYGANLYAIGELQDARTVEDVGAALRAEKTLGTAAEASLSWAARKNRPMFVGADLSAGLWDLDFRLEGVLRHNDRGPYYSGDFDLARGQIPQRINRFSEWIPQVVAGLEYAFNYSDEDSMTVGIEYFWNDAGYRDATIYPFLFFSGAFRPLYVGRQYAGVYAFLPGPGHWNDTTFIFSTLSNVTDRSYLARLDYRMVFLTHVNLDVFANYHFGRNGEFNFGLNLPPVPGTPLTGGLHTDQPLVDLGAGLRVVF